MLNGIDARKKAYDFSVSQLDHLMKDDGWMNLGTLASIESSIASMENGWRARLFRKNAAMYVLGKATAYRQAETGPTNRWIAACVIESLATLRLLSLVDAGLRSKYISYRDKVLHRVKKIVEEPRERKSIKKPTPMGRQDVQVPFPGRFAANLDESTVITNIDPRKGMNEEQIRAWIDNDPRDSKICTADHNVLGFPLGSVDRKLRALGLLTRRQGPVLTVELGDARTVVRVEKASKSKTGDGMVIGSIVTIQTALPEVHEELSKAVPCYTALINRFATLGALTEEHGRYFVGSQLPVFTGETNEAKNALYVPLVVAAVRYSFSSLQRGTLQAVSGASTDADTPKFSKWSGADLEDVGKYALAGCECDVSQSQLTAQVPVYASREEEGKSGPNAKLIMLNNVPNPVVGGGLLCRMQLPIQLKTEDETERLCRMLNRLESNAADKMPHFGAWTKLPNLNVLCYTTYLPNSLYSVRGIAVNFASWAKKRASWGMTAVANSLIEEQGNFPRS